MTNFAKLKSTDNWGCIAFTLHGKNLEDGYLWQYLWDDDKEEWRIQRRGGEDQMDLAGILLFKLATEYRSQKSTKI